MPVEAAPAGATPATALEKQATPAFDPAELAYYSGGDMLVGATVDEEPVSELPDLWTPENAAGGEEETPKAEPQPAPEPGETAPEPKPEEVDTDTDTDKVPEKEPVESPEARERKAWPESAQKRVDKLTAEKSDISRERDELKAQLETEREVASLPQRQLANPLEKVTKDSTLEWHEQFSAECEEWAEDNADGGELPPFIHAAIKGKPIEEITEPWYMTPEEVRNLKRNARRMQKIYLPQRRKYLDAERGIEAGLRQDYPAIFEEGSVENKLAAQLESKLPQLKTNPAWREFIAYAVYGFVSAKAAKAGKKGDEPPPAPVPPNAAATRGAVRPSISKPERAPKLKPSMNADELAAAM